MGARTLSALAAALVALLLIAPAAHAGIPLVANSTAMAQVQVRT
jgi:hypothetical protein